MQKHKRSIEQYNIAYCKVVDTILSCNNIRQIVTANMMILNFFKLFEYSSDSIYSDREKLQNISLTQYFKLRLNE